MTRWTKNDEYDMVKLVQRGTSLEDIAKGYNRSVEDIEKRLKKIIYENIAKGLSCKAVSKILKLPEEKINLYFDLYNEYRKKQKEKYHEKHNINDEKIAHHSDHKHKINFDSKTDMLEKENRFLKAILDNKKLHGEVSDMINKGKIDKNIKKIIEDFRTANHQ
jgi:transposase